MAVSALAQSDRLRPAAMQSKPVIVDKVFSDPEAFLRLIRSEAPYETQAQHDRMGDTMGWTAAFPWFKRRVTDPGLLEIPAFVQASKQAFSAGIVRPFMAAINVYGPMKSGPPHLDGPRYRGLTFESAPIWLLMNMTYSGLFHDWAAPMASGLAWFYDGEGGEFEYWPDGPEGMPARIEPPLDNFGVVSDNEFMWHRVGPIGPAPLQEKLHFRLRPTDLLHFAGDDAWEIRDGDRIVQRLDRHEVRISLLWKAFVFRDETHLASFEDASLNLDLDQVVDIYRTDLSRRGIAIEGPGDPCTDEDWRKTLQAVYPPPFDGSSR
ncbi:hypothetical protein [Novosphingobium sp. JCM 18896]|uniref:hypothetical protein n=1 Tax=Novosphingobium sp. JCM 18896 TaxID=2989731 RepID=UPI00222139BC|nr:hypothetical protein [Novosphingobium sp. JCM 18896]MCW1431718.1 hypothetical protein [Novosphingobium sp. JCM 18896]